MKAYRVTVHRDGKTHKVDGGRATDIDVMDTYYAAESIEAVWRAIAYERADPEATVVAVVEVLSAIHLVKPLEQP